jgi:hypothetical protein
MSSLGYDEFEDMDELDENESTEHEVTEVRLFYSIPEYNFLTMFWP